MSHMALCAGDGEVQVVFWTTDDGRRSRKLDCRPVRDTTVRPGQQAYEASWPTRKRQALGLGGGALVVFFVVVVVGIVRQPSSALLILLLLVVGGLAAVGIFAIEFAYLRNAPITVESAGLHLSGVPFSRNRTSPGPAAFERATVDFGRGVQTRVWLAVDRSEKPLLWTCADFWEESSIDQLAQAIDASVSGDWSAAIAKPAAPKL
jgi:hypothetical protein